MRINKHLAHNGGLSRREADDLVESGKVTINGSLAKHGNSVSEKDVIAVNGKKLDNNRSYQYVVLNKPAGYVCSRKEQDNAPTVYNLLPVEHQTLKTVGRLDKDSSGIILLTDDGDFAQTMTHPKYSKKKVYEIILDKPLEDTDLEKLNSGIELKDGPSTLKTTKLPESKGYQIIMHEGRNRQIRRTLGELGYTVKQLNRIKFGPYELLNLGLGKFEPTNKLV